MFCKNLVGNKKFLTYELVRNHPSVGLCFHFILVPEVKISKTLYCTNIFVFSEKSCKYRDFRDQSQILKGFHEFLKNSLL